MPVRRKKRKATTEEMAVIENIAYVHMLDGRLDKGQIISAVAKKGYNRSDVALAVNKILRDGKYDQEFEEFEEVGV